MIHVYMSGRLGNQFFRYAFARKLQLLSEDNPKIVMTFPASQEQKSDDWFGNQIQYFKLNPNIEYRYDNNDNAVKWYKEHLSLHNRLFLFLYLFFRHKIKNGYTIVKYQKLFSKFFSRRGIYIQAAGYVPEHIYYNKNIIINGHYEAENYFYEIKNILLDEFSPKKHILSHNVNLFNLINNTESVCISVRRGDFLAPEHKNHFHVCTSEYYFKAIEEIRKRIKTPTLFFFSDDIEWCKATFTNLPEETHFELGTDPVWEKLRLMTACKHFIIANSTFSWWAQELSRNPNKIVISPSRFNNRKDFCSPLILQSFVTVDV